MTNSLLFRLKRRHAPAWVIVLLGVGPLAQADDLSLGITGEIKTPPCLINAGTPLTVDFKSLAAAYVDGIHYRKPINFSLDCSGAGSTDFSMTLKGALASDDRSLQVENDDVLAIRVLLNGQPWTLNTPHNFEYSNLPTMEAVPVKLQEDGALTGGGFKASATLEVQLQ